ncbi:hypothetical protein [Candidatus Phytoplasma phoenicium]|uniref:Uncharacterized protein n=1 Tax=Candidatus Phytoplasma phoenicium TaxID=198422 RepID=A0A0L0MKC2_9MOLU|nr:hypothetical protein [Candidatus Phytoplasma phoenicium]KND62721.1 hypothetical protein AlmWB_00670 [Candidatus Phytoplasma phoenicium]
MNKLKQIFFLFLLIILAVGTYFLYAHYHQPIKIKFDFENPYEKINLTKIKQEDIAKIFPHNDDLTAIKFKPIIQQFRKNFQFKNKISAPHIYLAKDQKEIVITGLKKDDFLEEEFKFAETSCQETNPITKQSLIVKTSFYFQIMEKEKDQFTLKFLSPKTETIIK